MPRSPNMNYGSSATAPNVSNILNYNRKMLKTRFGGIQSKNNLVNTIYEGGKGVSIRLA